MTELKQLATARYEESGLDERDAKSLKLKPLTARQTRNLDASFKELPSLQIPYFHPITRKPLTAWERWPAFYRLRYLDSPKDFTMVSEKKGPRYVQPPDSGVCAYFPLNFDWKKVLETNAPIIITEGEFKAAKACREGFPTIGLGGVWNFQSTKLGIPFLKELEDIDWVKREIFIMYDSDVKSNEQVCHAINAIANHLMARGAIPYESCIPSITDNGKTGLDDFLVNQSPDALREVIDAAQPLTLSKKLWDINRGVLYVHDPGLIITTETDQKITPGAFKEHAFSTLDYAEQTMRADGTISLKKVSAAAAWLKWPMRREVGRLTYEPGAKRIIEGETPRKSKYNIWQGWGCEPKKGSVQPFLDLIDHLFTGSTDAEREWFLKWLAYPLQHPGTKLFTAAVIHGTRHGTGKSLLGYTMGRIYGKNFAEISEKDLHSSFNEWSEAKQFVLGDDVTGSNRRQDADMLKKLITQQELRVNMKFLPTYVVPDCINYLFTSNHPDAFFLEDDDRRYFIHEVIVGPLGEEFYDKYMAWLNNGGAANMFYYLLHLNLKGFNPAATALKTMAKDRMIADGKGDLASWVAEMLRDPDHVLCLGEMKMDGDLFTNKQLLAVYDPTEKTKCTANGLGRELRRAGISQVCNGRPIVGPDGQDRYYAIRHMERWKNAETHEVKAYLNDQVVEPKKAKF